MEPKKTGSNLASGREAYRWGGRPISISHTTTAVCHIALPQLVDGLWQSWLPILPWILTTATGAWITHNPPKTPHKPAQLSRVYTIKMRWEQHNHWMYAWIPLFGVLVWFFMLWAMLIVWLAQGRPKYPTMTGSIAYISDIGADILKPLFITGCSITAACFVMSLVVERWLRYRGRLVPTMRRRERMLSTLAILGSIIGGAGLILLSIFDTKRHHSAHRTFLLVFIIGVALSAIFTITEFHFISRDYVEIRRLKWAYILKGVIVTILILLAIAFAIALYTARNAGAVLEWTIAFGFTFYLLTFIWDMRMAKGVQAGELRRERLLAIREEGRGSEVMREASVAARKVMSKLRPNKPPNNQTGPEEMARGQGPSMDGAQAGGVSFPQPVYVPPGNM